MKRVTLTGGLLLALILGGCSDDTTTSTGTDATGTLADAAAIIVDNVAVETGGILDEVEAVLLGEDAGTLLERPDGTPGKDVLTDEAVFDSTTCTWTRTRERSREGEFHGHTMLGIRTVHLMDADGGCIMYRDTLGSVKGMDTGNTFEGTSWDRRGSWEKSGDDQWQIREMHDDINGVLVNGSHERQGAGEMTRHQETHTWEFTLLMTATDLRVIQRDGRRVPVSGTITIVFDGVEDGVVVHREATITFGDDGGGELVIGSGHYGFNPLSGELQ